ncbi:MAG: PDP protein [Helicobacteraceae bacterium]|jgi:flagellar motility protein MotE (MotC chaperone)|nr:PDP protein [Helicobacteraceae bacterium]
MKTAFVLTAFVLTLAAADDCNAIFDGRKNEILFEIDRLDRSKSELDALGEATKRILTEKENAIKAREEKIAADLNAIEEERAKIEAALKTQEELLARFNEAKEGKLTDLYGGMKASNAGEIMNALDPYLAADILSRLDSKTAAAVLARIEPANAAAITGILHKGPPFIKEQNATKDAN